ARPAARTARRDRRRRPAADRAGEDAGRVAAGNCGPARLRSPHLGAQVAGDRSCLGARGRGVSASTWNDLPLERLLKINEVCNRFERALQAAEAVRVEDFLPEVIEADRPILESEMEAIQAAHGQQSDEPPPKEIGEYLVEAELGRGGMGRVYRGVHRT